MTLRFCTRIATALTLTLVPMAAVADGVWQGSWDTSYPDLNLTQEGQLVYGEYEGLGWIVGMTDASGSILRGAWVYDSGRWGALEFRMQPGGASFVGEWDEDVTSFRYGSGTAWNGTRQTVVPMYSTDFNSQIEWPPQFDFSNPGTRAWLENGQGTNVTPLAPVTASGCPEVAYDPSLTAANNSNITRDGISDPTSAPWAIVTQQTGIPLGSLSFQGDLFRLQLDACIPLFGPTLGDTRRVIEISGATLTQNGTGDYEGTGQYVDHSAGMQGEISFYLTNPAYGEGIAALTVGNGREWAESVVLDYTAD